MRTATWGIPCRRFSVCAGKFLAQMKYHKDGDCIEMSPYAYLLYKICHFPFFEDFIRSFNPIITLTFNTNMLQAISPLPSHVT